MLTQLNITQQKETFISLYLLSSILDSSADNSFCWEKLG